MEGRGLDRVIHTKNGYELLQDAETAEAFNDVIILINQILAKLIETGQELDPEIVRNLRAALTRLCQKLGFRNSDDFIGFIGEIRTINTQKILFDPNINSVELAIFLDTIKSPDTFQYFINLV